MNPDQDPASWLGASYAKRERAQERRYQHWLDNQLFRRDAILGLYGKINPTTLPAPKWDGKRNSQIIPIQ